MSRRKEYDSVEPRDDFELSIDGKDWSYRDPRNQEQAQRGAPSYFRGNVKRDNPHAYNMTNPLYDYSYGQVRDAAKELNIGNVDEADEVNRLMEYMQKPRTAEAAEPVEEKKDSEKDKSESIDTQILLYLE